MNNNPKASRPIDQYLGSRIRQRRTLIGLSQAELGEAIGVTFQQVQKYEKGVSQIGVSRLSRIAEALDTSVDYLLKGAPGSLSPGSCADRDENAHTLIRLLDDRDGRALAQGFFKIGDPAARQIVLDLVAHLAAQADQFKPPWP